MTQGIRLFRAGGTMVYSSDSVTWNQVDYFYLPAGGSVNNSYPVIDGKECQVMLFFVSAPPANMKAVAPTSTVTGTTVSISGGTVAVYALVMMR